MVERGRDTQPREVPAQNGSSGEAAGSAERHFWDDWWDDNPGSLR